MQLPIPQLIANYEAKSTAGFRMSVLAAWAFGDTFKLLYYLFTVCCDSCDSMQTAMTDEHFRAARQRPSVQALRGLPTHRMLQHFAMSMHMLSHPFARRSTSSSASKRSSTDTRRRRTSPNAPRCGSTAASPAPTVSSRTRSTRSAATTTTTMRRERRARRSGGGSRRRNAPRTW